MRDVDDEPETPSEPADRMTPKDAPGVGISALISVGLFALPWLLALLVGVWADLQPANDIVVELYEPLEAVYLELDPPVDDEADLAAVADELLDEDEVGGEDEEDTPEEPQPDRPEPEDDTPERGGGGDVEEGEEVPEGDLQIGEGDDDDEGSGEGDAEGDDDPGYVVPKRRRRGGKRAAKCRQPHPNVNEGSDGIMEIDRSLVEYYTKSLERFMELGYSEPYEREGIKGFYIGGFGCTSPVYKAGFRRGDMLITVNGKKTRTWVGVFLLYKKLRRQTDFEVVFLRRGDDAPRTMHFRVVDGS